jgi:hypothetical protein
MTTEGGDLRDCGDGSRRLPSWREDTYATRLARLQRRSRQVVAVGVALTAFVVAVAAGDAANGIYSEVPGWLRAMIFTLVVAAGAGLAFAYLRFEEETERIEEAIEHRADMAAARIGDRRPPRHADAFWIGALVCTGLAPVAFVTAAWWAAF